MILTAKILKKLGACSTAYIDLKNFNLTKTNVAKQARENTLIWKQYRIYFKRLLRLTPEKVKFFDMVDAHL